LNLSSELAKAGVLEKYGVRVIGVQIDAIKRGEDRQAFKDTMDRLGIEMPKSKIANNKEEAEEAIKSIGLPCVIRPAYTMGGTGGGFAYNMEEFHELVDRGLNASMVHQILVEESVEGWEELELEVVRDAKNQMITVCFIENVDAMGVHTGDSYCTAPMLTISEELQQRLQKYSYDIVEAIEVIGGTNVQFAHDPVSDRVVVIEINPRTSRSSALASKATGFPIAYVSSLLAGGLTMDEIPYWRDGTLEKYTPSGDYVVVKFSRWAFEKFEGLEDKLGTQMKAVGEVMSLGKNYKEAFQKAIRSREDGRYGLGFARDYNEKSLEDLMAMLAQPSSERQFIMYEAIRKGATLEQLHETTHIKAWFLEQMKELVDLEEEMLQYKGRQLPDDLLAKAKKDGFSDKYISKILGNPEPDTRKQRIDMGMLEGWHPVPVSGVENAAYYYSTYNAPDVTEATEGKRIMVLGGGPNRIGQGIEFDYCCVHAAFALRDEGIGSIMVNCNPETVSTDFDTSDKLYFEPLTVEDVLSIYEKEKPDGVICQFGGQTPLNIAAELEAAGVTIVGTSPNTIGMAEDRDRFRQKMEKLGIPQPESGMASTLEQAMEVAGRIGYPLMVRPSFVLGGRAMQVVHDDDMLRHYMQAAVDVSPERPILIDRFLENAVEAEADAMADGEDAFVPAVMEHIELAGVHSGDSACVIPPTTIPEKHIKTIREYTRKIAIEFNVIGLMNIQYAICDDKVYILEANPRASRTVPLVSKVCGVSMARIATQLMLGKKLKDMNLEHKEIPHYGVKESVFPFYFYPEVDPVLGPEMRSTGEVLGIADSFGLAFYKAQDAAQGCLPVKGSVLMTIADQDKTDAAIEVARQFVELGFALKATTGTRDFLLEHGVESEHVFKMREKRPHIADAVTDGDIQLLINTPIGKASKVDDSYIRKAVVRHKVPYITTLAAASAAAKGIADFIKTGAELRPLQSYHEDIS